MNSKYQHNISIYPILGVNFVGTLGFSIVLPFLIFLVTRFGGNAVIYGIVGAAYSLFQLIGAPVLGRWSDRMGRKRILLLSQLGTLFSWIIFLSALLLPQLHFIDVNLPLLGTFSLTLPLIFLFLARSFDGLTGGNVSVANAYLADISDDTNRNTNFGKMAVSANLGFIIGPAIAGVLGGTSLQEILPVLAAILISAIAALLIAFVLPESNPCAIQSDPQQASMRKIFGQEHKECYEYETDSKVSLKEALRQPYIPIILVVYFLVFLAFNFFYVAFPVHAVQVLNWNLTETGVYFSFMGISMALVQGPVLNWISKKWSESILIFSGSILLAIGFGLYLSNNIISIYSGAIFIALGNGIMWPSILSFLSTATDQRYQGLIQGFASSSGSVASILGLLLGGILYSELGGWVFIISAAVSIIVSAFSVRLSKISLTGD